MNNNNRLSLLKKDSTVPRALLLVYLPGVGFLLLYQDRCHLYKRSKSRLLGPQPSALLVSQTARGSMMRKHVLWAMFVH